MLNHTSTDMNNASDILTALAACDSHQAQIEVVQQAMTMPEAEAINVLHRLSLASSKQAQLNVLRCAHIEWRTIDALDSGTPCRIEERRPAACRLLPPAAC